MQKQKLAIGEIESQTAFELPQRDMLALVNVVIFDVLTGFTVNVPVQNNNVAVQVCAVVQAINTILTPGESLTCTVAQR